MTAFVEVAGPDHTLEVLGIRLIGVSAENGKKLLFSVAFLVVVILLNRALKLILRLAAGEKLERVRFWSHQAIRLLTAAIVIVGLLSI